jgi:outer membrane protein
MKKITGIFLFIALTTLALQAQDLGLSDYLKLVEENSKDLYLARIDQDLAENQEKQVRSATRPMISAGANYNRNIMEITQPFPVGAIPVVNSETGLQDLYYADVPYNSKNEFSINVGVQQMLFDMKIFKALEASRLYTNLTETVYEASRQGILTAAKKVYFQTVLLNEVYKVKLTTEENAYEAYLDTQKRYDNELASELEVLGAEVNWQINIPETTQSARNRDLAMSNLKHMAGIDQDKTVVLSESLDMIPQLPENEGLGAILSSRPDFQALHEEKALREINISANRAEFFPSLSATAGYGIQAASDEFRWQNDVDAFQVGLTLTIPIYYGGSRFAKMEQARLELQKSDMSILKKQDEVSTEINNLQLLLDEASSRIFSAEKTLETAKKAYTIMEISSKNGLATQLDLKDSLLNLDGAQLNYYKAIYDYLDAYFNWQQAVGEGDILPY